MSLFESLSDLVPSEHRSIGAPQSGDKNVFPTPLFNGLLDNHRNRQSVTSQQIREAALTPGTGFRHMLPGEPWADG